MKNKIDWPNRESDAIMEKYLLNQMYGKAGSKPGFFTRLRRKAFNLYMRIFRRAYFDVHSPYPEAMKRTYLPLGSAGCLASCLHYGVHDTNCPNNPVNLKTYYLDTDSINDSRQAEKTK